jgi:hypothetical protein
MRRINTKRTLTVFLAIAVILTLLPGFTEIAHADTIKPAQAQLAAAGFEPLDTTGEPAEPDPDFDPETDVLAENDELSDDEPSEPETSDDEPVTELSDEDEEGDLSEIQPMNLMAASMAMPMQPFAALGSLQTLDFIECIDNSIPRQPELYFYKGFTGRQARDVTDVKLFSFGETELDYKLTWNVYTGARYVDANGASVPENYLSIKMPSGIPPGRYWIRAYVMGAQSQFVPYDTSGNVVDLTRLSQSTVPVGTGSISFWFTQHSYPLYSGSPKSAKIIVRSASDHSVVTELPASITLTNDRWSNAYSTFDAASLAAGEYYVSLKISAFFL